MSAKKYDASRLACKGFESQILFFEGNIPLPKEAADIIL